MCNLHLVSTKRMGLSFALSKNGRNAIETEEKPSLNDRNELRELRFTKLLNVA